MNFLWHHALAHLPSSPLLLTQQLHTIGTLYLQLFDTGGGDGAGAEPGMRRRIVPAAPTVGGEDHSMVDNLKSREQIVLDLENNTQRDCSRSREQYTTL